MQASVSFEEGEGVLFSPMAHNLEHSKYFINFGMNTFYLLFALPATNLKIKTHFPSAD